MHDVRLGANISQMVILIHPPNLYPSSKSPRFPRRTSISSAASNALHTNSIGSYLSASYK